MTKLNCPRRRAVARILWRRGHCLGDIAREMECSIYDLSPWIYERDLDVQMRERYAD